MNIKHLLLSATTLLCFTNTYSMELQNVTNTNNQNTFLSTPKDIWLYLIAHYHIKDDIRKTCKYFNQFIKRNKQAILTHPSLVITKEASDKFAFYYAALGNTAVVQNLLNKGANPTTHREDNGMKLINYAIRYTDTDMLDVLLKHSVHLPIKDQIRMKTAGLCYASEKGLFDAVQKLLTGTFNINTRNYQGKTPLYIATEQGDVRIMELLLSNDASPNEGYHYKRPVNDSYCVTINSPLHTAIEHGHTIAVQLLIEYGTKISHEDIFFACEKSHTQIFKLLLNESSFPINTYTYNNSVINQLIEKHNAKLKQNKKEQKEPEKENDNCVVQ